jgi:hypothetical protein
MFDYDYQKIEIYLFGKNPRFIRSNGGPRHVGYDKHKRNNTDAVRVHSTAK